MRDVRRGLGRPLCGTSQLHWRAALGSGHSGTAWHCHCHSCRCEMRVLAVLTCKMATAGAELVVAVRIIVAR